MGGCQYPIFKAIKDFVVFTGLFSSPGEGSSGYLPIEI